MMVVGWCDLGVGSFGLLFVLVVVSGGLWFVLVVVCD